jgi:ubiquinone/menaquinone biosynthesis C-methylase UbiE
MAFRRHIPGMHLPMSRAFRWGAGFLGGLACCSLPAQEQSVKPGINDNFQQPDPAAFVERWEKEGREIYDQREEILGTCELQRGQAAADVGAGTGLFTRLMARAVGPEGKVYAVDIARNFVDHILKTSREQGLGNVTGVVCTTDDARLPEKSVDLVFLCDTYHHFEFPEKTMRSICRALRPGGRLVLVDFKREPGQSTDWVMQHVRAGQAEVRREIEAAGLEFVDEKPILRTNYIIRFRKPAGS